MTNYVLLYTGGSMPETEEENQAVMAAWGAWYGAMGEAVVDGGNPFSRAMNINSDGAWSDGSASNPGVTGYTIVAADSMEAACAMAADCPHLTAGGQVTVHETMQM